MTIRRGEGKPPPNAKRERNAQILRDSATMTNTEIMAKYGLSRQRVIVIQNDERRRRDRQRETVMV